MRVELFVPATGTTELRSVAAAAFGDSPDADVSEWFSFDEMTAVISRGRGICVQACDATGLVLGFIYAQQENPINGKEGTEKWMVVILAVDPGVAGTGIGTVLLHEIERRAADSGAVKMFVYTNQGDDAVVGFYHKNGYMDAGWVQDYQNGQENSAVFLLKYLGGAEQRM